MVCFFEGGIWKFDLTTEREDEWASAETEDQGPKESCTALFSGPFPEPQEPETMGVGRSLITASLPFRVVQCTH